MTIVFLGFTFLLADQFPIVGDLVLRLLQIVNAPLFNSYPVVFFRILSLLITYASAALVVGWFIRKSRLRERLPIKVAGTGFLVWGIAIITTFTAFRLFGSTVQGGGISLVIGMAGIVPLIIAKALLFIGAVRVLLCVQPIHA